MSAAPERAATGAEVLSRSLVARPPRRVLVVIRDHVGDAVMSTGAVAAIATRFPAARITLETSRRAAGVFDNFPGLHRLRRRRDDLDEPFAVLFHVLRRFDLVIVLNDWEDRARVAWWGGSRRIVGVRETGDGRPFSASVLWSPDEHDVYAPLRGVLALLGAGDDLRPRLYPDAAACDAARAALARAGGGRRVGLFVDAARDEKRWPLVRFLELARRLEADGVPTVAFAGLGGAPRLAPFREGGLAVAEELARPLALAEFVRGLAVLVTNDSAPAHIAGAVGTPAVVLYGPTLPRRFGPWGERQRLLHGGLGCDLYLRRCAAAAVGAACDRRCLEALHVDNVLQAVRGLLAEAGGPACH
jgi:ADP-heptose:LPS heptosyltransferase